MPRMRYFEDKVSADWPDELRQLARVAGEVWSSMAQLDALQERRPYTRAAAEDSLDAAYMPLTALAGDAYKLLQAIRAEGERRLAAWEEEQRGEAERQQRDADADDAARSWACPKCMGRGYEKIGPMRLNCDACEGTGDR